MQAQNAYLNVQVTFTWQDGTEETLPAPCQLIGGSAVLAVQEAGNTAALPISLSAFEAWLLASA